MTTETAKDPISDPELDQDTDAALAKLQARVSEVCALIKRHGIARKRKRRGPLSTLNWAAIRHLFVVERWPATRISRYFDVAPRSILLRNKRERWREHGPRSAPDPELTTADAFIVRSMLDALALSDLPPMAELAAAAAKDNGLD